MNACARAIELQCLGMRLDPSVAEGGAGRGVHRTRAGLGSGLDLVIPGGRKDVWINVPVEEPFAARSPFLLRAGGDGYVLEGGAGGPHPVRLPAAPRWYDEPAPSGVPLSRIGILQGTYLGIYVGETCAFWKAGLQCHFCTTGLNVGAEESAGKSVEDVVAACRAAKEESGATFVHFNAGFQGGRELAALASYVKAVKDRVGMLVGVQATPARGFVAYDVLHDLGVDHLSFCYEFHDPAWFARLLPGKEKVFGQRRFLEAMAYCARLWGPGRISGEIIAGVEPEDATRAAIDHIVGVGAFPTVCIFRPLRGSRMEDHPPPDPEAMKGIFRHLAVACRAAGLPVGIAPDLEVSLVVQPDDALELLDPWDPRTWLYRARLGALRAAAAPILRRSRRPRAVPAPGN